MLSRTDSLHPAQALHMKQTRICLPHDRCLTSRLALTWLGNHCLLLESPTSRQVTLNTRAVRHHMHSRVIRSRCGDNPCLQIHDLAWTLHGDFLLSASADFTARLWPFQQHNAGSPTQEVSMLCLLWLMAVHIVLNQDEQLYEQLSEYYWRSITALQLCP